MDPIVTTNNFIALLGISPATFWRMKARGKLPPAVQISTQRIGWRTSVVNAWLDARRIVGVVLAVVVAWVLG